MRLFKRSSAQAPSAFSVAPTGHFSDNDGFWSTFKLQVGSGSKGGQNFEAVVSTSGFTTWLPLQQGCVNSISSPEFPGTNCSETRGVGLYGGSPSDGYDETSSSHKYGNEGGLKVGALDPTTYFGTDYTNISGHVYSDILYLESFTGGSAQLNSSTQAPIIAVISWLYYLSTIGIGFGTYKAPDGTLLDSMVSDMAHGGTIPSRSWGYTAGSQYDPRRLGSLTLGGYDTARQTGDPAQFTFKTGTSQNPELLVSVPSIAVDYAKATAKTEASSPGPFKAIIDSTLPYLFLPKNQCDWLAGLLGLTYDEEGRNIYLINATALASNRANIEALTITIGSEDGGSSSPGSPIAIRFPYAAFVGEASWTWNFPGAQAIFPLRRAPSDTGILGRVFFQEAYVSADFETGVFNVSKASQTVPSGTDGIITLYNATTIDAMKSGKKSKAPLGAIIGGAVGGAVVLILLAILLWFFIKRRRDRAAAAILAKEDPASAEKTGHRPPATRERSDTFNSIYSNSTAVSELHSTEMARRPSHHRGISELSSDSGHSERRGTAGTVGTLAYIDEMAHKSDAAELEGIVANNQRRDEEVTGLTPPYLTPPSELEGSFRFPASPPTSPTTSPTGR